ncbi:hypothetical protein B0H14DRAFT_2584458 [Mycena olivaceomarginata]|nr:hypothetical protein B0H14DRAFT_2584458 [Mycena olivaceomarginata]
MRHKAIVILRDPHNHPMHPRTKPSAVDKFKLGSAVKSTGLTGLTVRSITHEQCPAPPRRVFTADSLSRKAVQHLQTPGKFVISLVRKRRQNILAEWGGKAYFITLTRKKAKLLKSEWYIFTAMSKNGFRLVVTMHPQIALLTHKVLLSLISRLSELKAKWMSKRWLELWSDSRSAIHLPASIATRRPGWPLLSFLPNSSMQYPMSPGSASFKLAPFYPDATSRVIILDGEVPQAQGFGNFLATYNNPEISQTDKQPSRASSKRPQDLLSSF